MKKVTITFCLIFFFALLSFSKQIPPGEAKIAAHNFLIQLKTSIGSSNTLDLIYTSGEKAEISNGSSPSNNYFYVFSIDNDKGFVIISADDRVIPILGYSLENRFETNNIPAHVEDWLQGYNKQIKYAIDYSVEATKEIERQWKELLLNRLPQIKLSKKGSNVNYLIKTNWGQLPYYNDMCPYDSDIGRRVPTGCVATAMAQVLKYYDHPAKGTGSYSYVHSKYGKLSANFGSRNYDWFNMPKSVISSNDSIVSTLIYHCAVSIDMDFSPNASGAYPDLIPYSFKNYFGYSNTISFIKKNSMSDSVWTALIKKEIDYGRPVIYSGYAGNYSNGHCFIADGYNNNDMMHINWGWNGGYDGYYGLRGLNPAITNFSSFPSVVIGIEPNNSSQYYKLNLTKDVKTSVSEMEFGSKFTISTNIKNTGTNTFKGNYYAILEDSTGKRLMILDSISEYNGLTSNSSYSSDLTFNYNSGFIILPGKYIISIYQKADGGYFKRLNCLNQTIKDRVEISIVYNHYIEMNSAVSLNPKVLVKGFAASANINLINKSGSVFKGQYRICLYKLDNSLAEIIDVKNEANGLAVDGTYNTPYISFSKSALSSESGEYYFVTEFKSDTSNDWVAVGSRYFSNYKKVFVVDPPKPDKYEVNNSTSQAYSFPMAFNNLKASVSTEDASCHKMSDYDYYKLVLPAGKKYTITPRLYDLYTAGNDKVYSLDVYLSYSKGGNIWSNPYDSILPAPITSNGGETYYFLVYGSPLDQTGTYQLSIDIKVASDAKEIETFSINTIPGTIDSKASKILLYVDEQTNITALSPVIAISEFARISPGSGVMRDFTNPVQYTVTAQDSSVKTWTVSVSKSLSFKPIARERNMGVKVYPNPVLDELTIELLDGELSASGIQCLDMRGSVIQVSVNYQGQSKYTLDVRNLQNGLYMVKVSTTQGLIYRKMEIQR
jgi:hypothetical protein